MNNKRKFAIFTTVMMGALAGMLSQVAPAAAATCADAKLNPKEVVVILLDRSGTMSDPGKCSGTNPRKWDCGLENARNWIRDNDGTAEKVYYIWQFKGDPADQQTGINRVKFEGDDATPRGYCASEARDKLVNTVPGFEGPVVWDENTALAGAYCAAVDDLMKVYSKKSGVPKGVLLSIKIESDGIENWTPTTDQCFGIDTTATFTPTATPTIVPGNPATVDGIPVTSWKAKMFDKGITGVAHAYPLAGTASGVDPAAFVPFLGTDANLPIITNVTFIEDYLPSALNSRTSAASLAVASPFTTSVGVTASLASLAQVASAVDPTIESLVSFYAGLAQLTGSRMTRIGSGTPVAGGTVGSYHELLGDADDSGCVGLADFNLIKQAYGQKAVAGNANAIRADLNTDGVVSGADYALLKAQYGTGCSANQGTVPLLGGALLGFEVVSQWSSATPIAITIGMRTEGTYSLKIGGTGNREIRSVAFANTQLTGVTSKLAIDVLRPVTSPNPPSYGTIQLFVSSPSAKLTNVPLGNAVNIFSNTANKFTPVTFAIPAAVKTAMTTTRSDLSIKVVLNAADPNYQIDNLRFVP